MYRSVQLFIVCVAIGITCQLQAQPQQNVSSTANPAWIYKSEHKQPLPDEDPWWGTFQDATLDSLINIAMLNNFDVQMAVHRINIAKQAVNSARSGYMPTLTLSGGWNKIRQSGRTAANANIHTVATDYWNLGLDMSWQIDVFGKIASGVKEKKAQWRASQAQYAATMVTLCSNLATSYIQLRMYQAQKQIADNHIESQNKVVKITEARHEAGLASKLDVTQANTVYYSTCASVPQIENSINSCITAIATLLGEYPESIAAKLVTPQSLPDWKHVVMTGVPADLIRRRPDIAEAEADLASYAAAVGIAKKDFLPDLSISGSIGTSAHNAKNLFSDNSYTYSIAPTLSWTIFDGLQRKYALTSAKEQLEAGIANYNMTVLSAVQEVNNAMSAYTASAHRISDLEKVTSNASESFTLAIDLYKRGLSPFTNVVDAQIDMLQYEDELIASKAEALIQLIQLYKALGGGWTMSQMK